MSKSGKVYWHNRTYIDEAGTMVTETLEETFETLREKYWQNWSDMRIIMQMPVNDTDFINDLKIILKLEEV